VSLRLRKRWGAVRLAAETGVAPSTAGAVLRRCRISRLSRLERRERPPANRYEHEAPGDLLHVDVKKLGNIPAGGGWRFLGRQQGNTNRVADGGRARSRHYDPLMRHGYIHVVLDDHSRLAYAEIHDDETGRRAPAHQPPDRPVRSVQREGPPAPPTRKLAVGPCRGPAVRGLQGRLRDRGRAGAGTT
jgi:hypothetical protein